MSKLYALIDCNNFYVSCERMFRPDLSARPVMVLSNNDGCVVSRSAEVKALGVPMAVPFFKIKHLVESHNIAVFSSNYAFYADVSNRVMQTIESVMPDVEIYSIDEAFVRLDHMKCLEDVKQACQALQEKILKWTGIPTSIGIGPTKTLAKLANHLAKQQAGSSPVVQIDSALTSPRAYWLAEPVGTLWGIGNKTQKKLAKLHIYTVKDLLKSSPQLIRKTFGVNLARTVAELKGDACFGLEQAPLAKKQIVCSRSFGEKVTDKKQMQQALANYAARACEKLRQQKQYAGCVSIFIRTSAFIKQAPFYSKTISIPLNPPSSDSKEILRQTRFLLEYIWKEGFEYAKAGVWLSDFSSQIHTQTHLFEDNQKIEQSAKHNQLMALVDQINRKQKGKIGLASQFGKQSWRMRRRSKSSSFTTNWQDLPVVK